MFDLLQSWNRAVGESRGGGWVVEMSSRGAGCAHLLEKSASSFAGTSIPRLFEVRRMFGNPVRSGSDKGSS